MARPTTSGIDNARGFAPETRQAPSLGVYASTSHADMSASKAQGLADALGVVSSIAQPALQKRIEKKSFENTSQGMADAANNTVDAKRQAEDDLYDRGARQVFAEKRTVDALDEYRSRYETKFDKSLGEDKLAQDIDSFAKERLGDLIGDPEMARVVAKRLLPFAQQMTGAHRANLSKEFQQEAIATVERTIRSDVDLGLETDFEGNVQRLSSLLGDRTKANQIVIGSIIDRAVSLGSPEIIDRFIPNAGANGVNVRATYSEAIDQGRAKALAVQAERDAAGLQMEKGDIEIHFVDRINGQNWLTDRELRQMQQAQKLTESERISWYSRSEGARLSELERAAQMSQIDVESALDPARRLASYVGALGPNGKPLSKSDMTEIGNRRVERAVSTMVSSEATSEETNAALLKAAAAFTRREGFVYEPLASALATVLPASGKAFEQAADTYAALDPTVREQYVTDRTQQARLTQFATLKAMNYSAQEATQQMAKASPDVVARNREAARGDAKKRQAVLNKRVVDDGGWFGSAVSVGDLVNSGFVAQEIDKRAEALISLGADAPTAYDTATEQVTKAWAVVPGPTKKSSLMVPRSAGVTERTPEELEWFYKSYLPTWLKSQGDGNLDAKNVRLAPMPGSDENTVFTVIDNTTLRPVAPGIGMTLRGLSHKYDEDRIRRGTQAAAEAAALAVAKQNPDYRPPLPADKALLPR